jgi:hypothetical protein
VHTVVARSTFRSQNVQNTPGPDRFWKLRCRKSARRCGAKHIKISKSKCTKHDGFGSLLDVQMSFLRGKRKGLCTLSKVSKTSGFCCIFNYNHHYTTLRSNTLRYNYNILHLYTYTTFLYATLHYTTTALHYIPLCYTPHFMVSWVRHGGLTMWL